MFLEKGDAIMAEMDEKQENMWATFCHLGHLQDISFHSVTLSHRWLSGCLRRMNRRLLMIRVRNLLIFRYRKDLVI